MPTAPDGFLLLAQADAVSGWTDKEVVLRLLAAVGGTLAVVIPVAWGLVKLLCQKAETRASELAAQNAQLRVQLAGHTVEDVADLRERLDQATKTVGQLEVTLKQVREQAEGYQKVADGLAGERDELLAERDDAREQLAAEQRRIRKATQKDGVTWGEKVLATAPDFKPLAPDGRRTPVVSVLNLKGGVGKTTTAANLGAALARRGWRVLMLDLDLQGSLTTLYLQDDVQEQRANARRLAGDFLEAAFDGDYPNLTDYAVPVLPGATCDLVPTTDQMAYAETNLTVRWYLRDASRDPRFLLRRELHLKRVTNEYDVVLLDCPPLINVSCVNALAASDYVLVPVLPSKQATDRVTVLIERLKGFRDDLNPDLQVMGFFANRTKESGLTSDERNRLSLLRDKCKDTWAKADCFAASVRQSAEVRRSEDERRPLGPGDDLSAAFDKLAAEVEERLPTFCRATGKPAPAREAVAS